MILRRERDRDQPGARGDLALADPVERGFDVMGEARDAVEAEHRARSLDGMQRAERAVDQSPVARRALEIEQRAFELLEQLVGLVAKRLRGIDRGHAPSTFLTTATSCSCWNGLVIQPVAPAALASRFKASSDSVVRKMIGTPL